ncbi:hypothetical protein AAG747_28755 [Rapidithrix thailandica]|uniref:Uncharacterized protein n=1 Tax=Rapidithrix thailandica TaxID=413964 RepID=A0AAW9S418_9BACT
MKINKTHFLATQNCTNEMVRDAIGITTSPISYGLLPSNTIEESVKISLVIDNHKLLRVKLEECHAITPNGARIEISSKNSHALSLEEAYPEAEFQLKVDGNSEMVLLANVTVNPEEKNPFGEPDPEENPPRYPYLLPTYQLNLVPEGKFIERTYSGYELTIGKIVITATETYLLKDYIPPSTTVSSHQQLVNIYDQIDKFLGQLELFAVQIAQKINRKNQTNDLGLILLQLCERIIDYTGREINSFRWFALHHPPAFMFDKVISLARMMKNFIDSKSGVGKEELLNYFAEWCSISQGDFEVLFTEVVNVGYKHSQIDETVIPTMDFMQTMSDLFSALNRLDIIGKRKDTGIFVKEREESTTVNKPQRSRTFLAD